MVSASKASFIFHQMHTTNLGTAAFFVLFCFVGGLFLVCLFVFVFIGQDSGLTLFRSIQQWIAQSRNSTLNFLLKKCKTDFALWGGRRKEIKCNARGEEWANRLGTNTCSMKVSLKCFGISNIQ